MTDVVLHNSSNDLAVQMDYARAITSGGRGSSILPDAYRDNPANALIAIGLGQAMGLTPAESLYRIAVIKGKPSASAELIAANVRKAGHKLRVRVQETPPRATATIVRADDPDEPVTIERDMDWATRMGLANEPNYKKQPATMLSYRAITACARLACPEALYGVAYTVEEAREIPDETAAPRPRATAADFTQPATPNVVHHDDQEDDAPPADTSEPDESWTVTKPQVTKVNILLRSLGHRDRDDALAHLSGLLGRDVDSSKHLTVDEASAVIDEMERDVAALTGADQ